MMVSSNPEYVKQSERILTFLKIARRNHLPKDLRMWIAVNYVKDVSIARNVPRVWMNVIFKESAASLHRLGDRRGMSPHPKEFMVDVFFISMFSLVFWCFFEIIIGSIKFLS